MKKKKKKKKKLFWCANIISLPVLEMMSSHLYSSNHSNQHLSSMRRPVIRCSMSCSSSFRVNFHLEHDGKQWFSHRFPCLKCSINVFFSYDLIKVMQLIAFDDFSKYWMNVLPWTGRSQTNKTLRHQWTLSFIQILNDGEKWDPKRILLNI